MHSLNLSACHFEFLLFPSSVKRFIGCGAGSRDKLIEQSIRLFPTRREGMKPVFIDVLFPNF